MYSDFFTVNSTAARDGYLRKLSRHLALNGWGISFQERLDAMRILVIGAGGLGSTLCLLLSGSVFENMGLTIMDNDVIDETNLHRQVAYTESDVGRSKAIRLAELCRERNRKCNVIAKCEAFHEGNAIAAIGTHDVIFDCTDNVQARILISDTWIKSGRVKLIISGSCVSWCGQLVTLRPSSKSCLRCVYGDPEASTGCDRLGQCALQGVMGPVVSLIASLQLMELFDWIRKPSDGPDKLRLFDFRSGVATREVLLEAGCCLCTGNDINTGAHIEQKPLDSESLTIEPQEFLELLVHKQCTVVDVRERSHFECSHFRESNNFPASQFIYSGLDLRLSDNIISLISLNIPVVVVCRRGIDSLEFTRIVKRIWHQSRFRSLNGGLYGLNLEVI